MTADDRRPLPPLHPDLDTLADLHAGALDPATEERVRAHVAGCGQCTAALAALDAVGADLRSLPAPVMPAAVAARLDATLADLRRDAGPGPAGDRTPATGSTAGRTPGTGAAGPDGRTSGPGSTAAGSGDAPGARGTGARDPHPVDLAAARERRRRRAGRAFGAVAAAVAVFAAGASVTAIVRLGSGSDDSGGGTAAAGDTGTEQAPAANQSPTTLAISAYDRTTLRADLPEIVRRSAVSIITGRDDTGRAGAMSDPGRRTACQNTIRGTTGDLEAVQRIEYEGRPAYVFVFSDDGRNTAYVVSDDCGTSPALPASVLDTVS